MHRRYAIEMPGRPPLLLGRTATIMGILNVTPDSFSDGGQHNRVGAAVQHALAMVAEGADIIDVGGESTRPGADVVSIQEELDRVMPVIDALRAAGVGIPISIDTYKPLVADQAIQAGAAMINDVHGLQGDPEMAAVAGLHGVPVIAMHWDKARDPHEDLLSAMPRYWDRTLTLADASGMRRDQVIADPGFGFGKSLEENYAMLTRLEAASSTTNGTRLPILVGTSRKSMIGKVLGNEPEQRLAGTIASNVLAYSHGGHIFRVHDVRAHRDALRVAEAALYGPVAEGTNP